MVKKLLLFLFIAAPIGAISYTLSVQFSTSAVQPQTQQDLIASITSQYQTTIRKSTVGSDTYTLTLFGPNPSYAPPAISSPILTSTAFDSCLAHGFGDGMEEERSQDIQLIYGVQGVDWANQTCGGQRIQTLLTTSTPSVVTPFLSSSTCVNYCVQSYNVIASTIAQRWGFVYTSTGAVVP